MPNRINLTFASITAAALAAAAPAHAQDLCASAPVITTGTTVSGDTSASGNEGGFSSCADDATSPDDWYQFTPASDGDYEFSLCGSSYDTTLSVWDLCPDSLGIDIFCNDDGCSGGNFLNSDLVATLTGGTTYWVRVSGYAGDAGAYTLSVDSINLVPPPNDNCADAIPLTLNTPAMGNAVLAGGDATGASCVANGTSHSVWFTFTPDSTAPYLISTCDSGYDTVLSVYSGACGALTEVDCNDDACGPAINPVQSQVNVALDAGQTYHVRVASYGITDAGDFVVEVSPGLPPLTNDDCTGSTLISALPFSDSFNNAFAASDGPILSCNAVAAGNIDNSVWYTFTPAADTDVLISAMGDGYDMILGAFSGASCTALTEVGCFDEPDDPVNWRLSLTAGTKYYFAIGDYGAAPGGGQTTFSIAQAESVGACCVAGDCRLVTPSECAAMGGSFQGEGASCAAGASSSHDRTDIFLPVGPDAGTFTSDTLTVSGAPASIGKVELTLDIYHSFISDLSIDLVHVPSGTSVPIFDQQCDYYFDMLATFADDGDPLVCASPVSGLIAPAGSLSDFNGLDANGDWRIEITDNYDGDGGTLNSWSLSFQAAAPGACAAPACPCETDGDNAQVNVFDLLAYLSDWFGQNGMSGAGLSADFNNSGNVDVFDLLDFLSCWFPASAGNPCP